MKTEEIIFVKLEEACCHIVERQLVFNFPTEGLAGDGVHALRKYVPVRVAEGVLDASQPLDVMIETAKEVIIYKFRDWVK